MPLHYDEVPGSWGAKSEGWPAIHDPDGVARRLVIKGELVPYGSYVTVGEMLRLERQEYVEKVTAAMRTLAAQQPAPAVELTYDQLFWAISAGVRKVGSDGSKHVSVSAFKEALGIDKSDSLFITLPSAIDIGKLRELVGRWRESAAGAKRYSTTAYEDGCAAEQRSCANELAALIGDGGRAQV